MLINAIPQYIQNITNAKADLTGTGVVTFIQHLVEQSLMHLLLILF